MNGSGTFFQFALGFAVGFSLLSACAIGEESTLRTSNAATVKPAQFFDLKVIQNQFKEPNSIAVYERSDGGGMVFLPCGADGNSTWCYLDSGKLSAVTYSKEFSSYPSLGQQHLLGLNGGVKTSDIILVKNFEFAGNTVGPKKIQRITVEPGKPHGFFSTVEMHLGNDVLLEAPFEMNFKARLFRLNPTNFPERDLQSLTVSNFGQTLLTATVENQSLLAMWDTGCAFTVVDRKFVDANPSLFSPISEVNNFDASGKIGKVARYKMKNIQVGSLRLEDHIVVATSLEYVNEGASQPVVLLLGYNAISRANWYFDVPKKVWAVEPF
ncbi:retropepsin-like domain-containing protein [bacterium]|nr:retropepsin-like domain-containing protein [bacterium]